MALGIFPAVAPVLKILVAQGLWPLVSWEGTAWEAAMFMDKSLEKRGDLRQIKVLSALILGNPAFLLRHMPAGAVPSCRELAVWGEGVSSCAGYQGHRSRM